MKKLTSVIVNEILRDCLFNGNEDSIQDTAIIAKGVMMHIGFHPGRLEGHRNDVIELLDQLMPKTREGCSFLEMCIDKDGNLWGQHNNIDELLCLGLALGMITFPIPRELWATMLPGGMPLVLVDTTGERVTLQNEALQAAQETNENLEQS